MMYPWFVGPVYKSRKRTGRYRITHRSVLVHYGWNDNRSEDKVIVQVEYECITASDETVMIWEDARPNDIMQREIKLEGAS